MEVNLPSIFSENSTMRTTAFSVVMQILQNVPTVDVSQMMSVLGRSYDEKGGDRVDIDSAKKAIEIMHMVAVRDVYPGFFSEVEVVKVLLGIFSKHNGVLSGFDESIELMFQRFSEAIYFAKSKSKGEGFDHLLKHFFRLSNLSLILDSQATISKYLPSGDEEILSPGKALCLKGMVGTFIWDLCSDDEIERVWNCVRIVFKTQHQHVEAIHTSLAQKLITENFISNRELTTLFTAIPPLLENAKDTRNGGLCTALCALLTTILGVEDFMDNTCTFLSLNFHYAVYLFSAKDGVLEDTDQLVLNVFKKLVIAREKLQSILAKCDFDDSSLFAQSVAHAKLAVDSI
ncbi:hypothetical protein FH972_013370 [Carpinus fangiana]|uniref:MMS19 nucleotide excision repair protein n=1 Tax=Carpinus fangiana TaxID=176857 RepID=A0A5N6R913_9ROSI|nr:hypothetical protein FH972_013370 [Carpinus fangiana]